MLIPREIPSPLSDTYWVYTCSLAPLDNSLFIILLTISQFLFPDKEVWSLQLLPEHLRLGIPLSSTRHNMAVSKRAKHLPSLETQTSSSAKQCGEKKERGWKDLRKVSKARRRMGERPVPGAELMSQASQAAPQPPLRSTETVGRKQFLVVPGESGLALQPCGAFNSVLWPCGL